jgi:hypothetical protein
VSRGRCRLIGDAVDGQFECQIDCLTHVIPLDSRRAWPQPSAFTAPDPVGMLTDSAERSRRSKLNTYTGVNGLSCSTLVVEYGTLVSVVPGSGVAALGR